MARIKKGKTKHARHLKIVKAAKGSRGRQNGARQDKIVEVEGNMAELQKP